MSRRKQLLKNIVKVLAERELLKTAQHIDKSIFNTNESRYYATVKEYRAYVTAVDNLSLDFAGYPE